MVGTLIGYVNPIANNTGRDPSTAWRTPAGEWRITTYGSQIYGSMDFKKWYHIGKQQGFPTGECPSFFPLPKSTPGAAAAAGNTSAPTHVIKSSHGGFDWMAVGSYDPGPPRQLGTFTHEDEAPSPYNTYNCALCARKTCLQMRAYVYC